MKRYFANTVSFQATSRPTSSGTEHAFSSAVNVALSARRPLAQGAGMLCATVVIPAHSCPPWIKFTSRSESTWDSLWGGGGGISGLLHASL